MKKILFLSLLLLVSLFIKAQGDDRGYIVKVGDKAPNITIKYLDGSVKKLSDLKGKVVMLQFTASWCGVCRQEMPHIEKDIWLKHKNNSNFVLLGVDLKEDKQKVEEFAKTMKITYPLVLDPEGEAFYSFAAKNAGVTRNIIIDKEGTIVFLTRLFDQQEFNDMIKAIEKLIQ